MTLRAQRRGPRPPSGDRAKWRPSGAHRIALLAAASLMIAACADVLGVAGYRDAVHELCGVCAGSLPECNKTLTDALATSKDSDVADWLRTYQDLSCDTVACDSMTALQCFYSAPGVCTALGAACKQSAECCGFDFDDVRKGSGCCAAGDGQCCDVCLTCAEAVGLQEPDPNTVCLSHRATLDAVVNCRKTTCVAACAASKITCDTCVNEKCKSQANACNNNKAP